MPNQASPPGRDPGPEALIRQALEKMLAEINSPAVPADVWLAVVAGEACRRLIRNWNGWTPQERRKGWEKAARDIEKAAYSTRPYCLRCGTCCRKGSPSLYRDDLPLFRQGTLTRLDLITLRRGEKGYSNEADRFVYLAEEQVKIREKPGSRECLFFQPAGAGCGVYENRPRQCRILECWNPEGYRSLKKNKLLSRKDLLDPEDPLLPVVKSHEERCQLLRLQEWLIRSVEQVGADDERVLEVIHFDRHARTYLGERFGLNQQHLDFLLGRPVEEVISGLGFEVGFEPGNRIVVRDRRSEGRGQRSEVGDRRTEG
ncbi:MAG: YkgJ family cysteine cluster protein [Deltaproteobacteria bacterium]|nr:YkgJ family cysteine cluster protein [Deltaproteobacteria bacterium]